MARIIIERNELARVCREIQSQGKRIVTTNGVFDLIHVGHIRYLNFCKELGDVLIVGVNADSSVKQYKGDKRPIVGEADRAELIAALSCVDYVHIFSERTPEAWLNVVKPAIHVKAGDYKLSQIIEKAVVEKNGGKIIIVKVEKSYSTTALIRRIISLYKNQ